MWFQQLDPFTLVQFCLECVSKHFLKWFEGTDLNPSQASQVCFQKCFSKALWAKLIVQTIGCNGSTICLGLRCITESYLIRKTLRDQVSFLFYVCVNLVLLLVRFKRLLLLTAQDLIHRWQNTQGAPKLYCGKWNITHDIVTSCEFPLGERWS